MESIYHAARGWLSGTTAWAVTLLASAVAIFTFADQLTFDVEMETVETRIMAHSDASDRQILERLLRTQEVIIAQQRQQFLTLRRQFLSAEVDRLRQMEEHAPDEHRRRYLARSIERLQTHLHTVSRELEDLLLAPKQWP